jgi:DNA primase
MALYTKESVERAKQAVDMVELVGSRTDLRRVGQRHMGLCPFHDERTPSFSVRADLGLYHCFGCGASGDAIRFVQETEGLDFRQAVELIADRYRVELRREREDPRAEERRRRRERLLGLVDRAATYYARYLWDSGEAAPARAYLAGRGISEEVLRAFRVGYAPDGWDRLTRAAAQDGFGVEELAAAGLGQRGARGGFIDRFRGRIMFPLADARGRVLGFGARAVHEEQRPKYLNTAENELYHKGRQLFGIQQARAPAARAGHVVVVEGYTDVLALHQVGLTESVAIMGTALTQEQLAELHRAAGTVSLALDADRAGQEAMLRAARTARSRGLELRVVALPEGRDPAELVAQEGVEAFRSLLGAALSVIEFEVRRVLADADLATAAGRDRALAAVRPLIASTGERTATRDELVRQVADRLDVPPAYVVTELERRVAAAGGGGVHTSRGAGGTVGGRRAGSEGGDSAGSQRGSEVGAPAGGTQAAAPSLDAAQRTERAFLSMCVAEPVPGRRYLERLGDEHFSSPAVRAARRHLAGHLDAPLSAVPDDDPMVEATLREIVMRAEEEPASEAALQLGFLQLDLRRIERALREARRAEDFGRQRQLWGDREEVRRELSTLMGEVA